MSIENGEIAFRVTGKELHGSESIFGVMVSRSGDLNRH